MEQTVNLPEVPSVVRIHPCPPEKTQSKDCVFSFIIGIMAFYCKNKGVLPFFIGYIAKMQACRDGFRPCKPFLFLAVKYKSFNLWGIVQLVIW